MSSSQQQPAYQQNSFAQLQQQPKPVIDYGQRQNQILSKYNFDYTQQKQGSSGEPTGDLQRSFIMNNSNINKPAEIMQSGPSPNIWQQPTAEAQPHPFQKTPHFKEFELRNQQPQQQLNMSHNMALSQQNGFTMTPLMNNGSSQSTPVGSNLNESMLGSFQNIYQHQQQQQQQQQQQLTQQQQLQLLSQLLSNNNAPLQRPLEQQQQQFQPRPVLQQQSAQPQINNGQFSAAPQMNNQLYVQQMLAQQQLLQRQATNDQQSLLSTPLESSRFSNQQPIQQEQQQYFAQNYQQLHENLSQYKKLISYLENIESSKRAGNQYQNANVLSPQMQQVPQPMLQATSQSRLDTYQPNNGMYDTINNSVIYMQPEEKLRPIQETSPVQQSFILPPSQSSEPENAQIVWPSAGGSELKSNRTFIQPSSYLQGTSLLNSASTAGGNIDYENNQMNDSYIDKKIQAINLDIKQQQNDNIQVLDVCQQQENDTSKASAEVTKESLTDAQINLQTMEDNNKSILVDDQAVLNQSHISQQNNDNSRHSAEESADCHQSVRSSEMFVVQADKPIVSKQMTFQELLESKLQEEQANEQRKGTQNAQPKREFLRKSSNGRANGHDSDRGKSKNKYKYYVDNFSSNNNSTGTNAIVTNSNSSGNPSTNIAKQSNLAEAQSPKATASALRRTTIENSTSSKKILSTQKSNQKQPKQQPANKQHQTRPQSQQQVTGTTKVTNRGARQSNLTPHLSSINVINKDEAACAQGYDEIVSERNSVLEFEMLEQECIEKYNQQQKSNQQQLQQEQPNQSLTNSVSKKQLQQQTIQQQHHLQQQQQLPPKVDKQQQRAMESKIQELDREILKFQKENKRVASMQSECEAQLKRITKEIEEFQQRKDDEMEDVEQWKHEQKDIIRKERAQLEKDKEQFNKNQLANIDQQSSEVEHLMARINQLETENFDLKDRLEELTDKELHCVGVQTTSISKADNSTMMDIAVNDSHSSVQTMVQTSSRENLQTDIHLNNPIDQITEEDEENYSKTTSEKPIEEEDEHSPLPDGESRLDDEAEESEEDEYDLKFPAEYHSKNIQSAVTEEVVGHDGKVQKIYANGKKEVLFTNGVKREVWPDGYSIVFFNNSDIKQTYADGKIVYYFSDAKTTQSTYPNGLQVFKFANSQIEKHFADGTKEISFPDGTIKCLFPDGEEESIFPDGTIQKIEKNGVRIVEFPNGQRDVLYPDGTKVREFEDGSVKKIYSDGRTEVLQSAHKLPRGQLRK